MEAALKRIDKLLSDALAAAIAYDRVATLRVPAQADRLSQHLDVVVRAARGEASTEEQLEAYGRALLRYVALAETLQKSASTENMKKAREALETFQKALGGG
jgi:molybdenum-dependent DNA-binding transcriptional regulator ModE